MLGWICDAHHVSSLKLETRLLLVAIGLASIHGGTLLVLYLAVEPYLRPYFGQRMISFRQLLAGQFRAPLVGRDILIGGVVAVCLSLLSRLQVLAPTWLGSAPPEPLGIRETFLTHPWFWVFAWLGRAIPNAFIVLVFVFVLLLILRKNWLVAGVYLLITVAASPAVFAGCYVAASFNLIWQATLLFALFRFGLLALAAAYYFEHLLDLAPITTDFSAWYAGNSLVAVLIFVCLTVCGFVIYQWSPSRRTTSTPTKEQQAGTSGISV